MPNQIEDAFHALVSKLDGQDKQIDQLEDKYKFLSYRQPPSSSMEFSSRSKSNDTDLYFRLNALEEEIDYMATKKDLNNVLTKLYNEIKLSTLASQKTERYPREEIVGNWAFHSGVLRSRNCIPWEDEISGNSQYFHWTEGRSVITIIEEGDYEINIIIFAQNSGKITTCVNSEIACETRGTDAPDTRYYPLNIKRGQCHRQYYHFSPKTRVHFIFDGPSCHAKLTIKKI